MSTHPYTHNHQYWSTVGSISANPIIFQASYCSPISSINLCNTLAATNSSTMLLISTSFPTWLTGSLWMMLSRIILLHYPDLVSSPMVSYLHLLMIRLGVTWSMSPVTIFSSTLLCIGQKIDSYLCLSFIYVIIVYYIGFYIFHY